MTRRTLNRGPVAKASSAEAERPRRDRGDRKGRLHVDGLDPNRVYRFVNDKYEGQSIAAKKDAGWILETNKSLMVGDVSNTDSADSDSLIKRYAGLNEEGKPMYCYLMSIDRDSYEADQRYKEEDIDATEEAVLYGKPSGADYAVDRFIEERSTPVIRRKR